MVGGGAEADAGYGLQVAGCDLTSLAPSLRHSSTPSLHRPPHDSSLIPHHSPLTPPPVPLLTQFIFRLSFGLALAMALTPSRWVTSGYYRVHSYVLLGLNALATLVALSQPESYSLWPPLTAAVLSYVSSVVWLYEKPKPGVAALLIVAGCSLVGAWQAGLPTSALSPLAQVLNLADPATGGLLLGSTMAAMLLGHWYLNTPTMQLMPLKRLVLLMAAATLARAAVCGLGLALAWSTLGTPETGRLTLLCLRWLAGLVATLLLIVMTWQTLKIPNTQSATGILYVAVITTFLGELTSQLLSAESPYPV